MPALPIVIAQYSRSDGPFETALTPEILHFAQDDNWFAFEMTSNTGARSGWSFLREGLYHTRFLTPAVSGLRSCGQGRSVLRPYIIVWRSDELRGWLTA